MIELNGTKIGAFPSHHLNDAMYVLPNYEKIHTHIDAALLVLTNVLCFFSLLLFLKWLAKSKISYRIAIADLQIRLFVTGNKAHMPPLKETQCDTQDEYVYANINENTSSSFYVLLSNYVYYY